MKGMASWMGGTVIAPTDKEQDTLRHKGATQPGVMYGSQTPAFPDVVTRVSEGVDGASRCQLCRIVSGISLLGIPSARLRFKYRVFV